MGLFSSSKEEEHRYYNLLGSLIAQGKQLLASILVEPFFSSSSIQTMRHRNYISDADVGAGFVQASPSSLASVNTINSSQNGDLEFFEDKITDPVLHERVLVLGFDISHYNKNYQFLICAGGLFMFSVCYGYLQELLSVELCSRKLGLFLAMMQFIGYTLLAYVLRNYVYRLNKHAETKPKQVPIAKYVGLSLLRAVDLAMTNMAMQYINYPAKTLMKSSRVVFTMIFGVLIQNKVYRALDYLIVLAMVVGLAMFLHADSTSSAVFEPIGVAMLTVSLVCDGAITNMSETIMTQYGVGQDEFIFRLYSISLIAITAAAAVKGDLRDGMYWLMQDGTYQQYLDGDTEYTWYSRHKLLILVVFSSMGFFGSSCSAAICKNFGALTMSITSTARKATTLFLSFFLFNNVCTTEHVAGIAVFISALTTKSLRRRKKSREQSKKRKQSKQMVENWRKTQSPNKSETHPLVHVV